MDFNSTKTYEYHYKAYYYGWMVYHIEEGNDVMDMCYANEIDAKSHAMILNMNEAKRAEAARVRIEAAKSRIVYHDTPYYSITGYYGD